MVRFITVLSISLLAMGCSMRPRSFEGIKHAPPQKIKALTGQSQKQVHKKFGAPMIKRYEGSCTLWSYQSDACAMLVYFDENNVCQHAETRGICQ